MDRETRWYALFAATNLLTLAAFAVVISESYFRQWKTYQAGYGRIVVEKKQQRVVVREIEPGIQQVWNPQLDVMDRCTSCHSGVGEEALADAPQPFTAHPATAHRFDEFGCTVCHRGQGLATTSQAAHGRGRLWEEPMLPGVHAQASCGQCHQGSSVPEAYLLNAGRRLIEKAACVACHEIPGLKKPAMIGPDLTGVGSKVHPYWLYEWLLRPKNFLPNTWMPNPLMSEREAGLLTTYLLSRKEPKLEQLYSAGLPEPTPEQVETGKRLFREARCISCHAVEGRGGTIGPELTRVASKVKPGWLRAWLENPKQYLPRTRMPQFSFPEKEIAAIAAYLQKELLDWSLDADKVAKIEAALPPASEAVLREGEQIYKKYGCGGCHTLQGSEPKGKLAPELAGVGRKDVDRLDFGRTTIPRRLWDWLTLKLKQPRAFGSNLRMPSYELEDPQARLMVTALLSLTGRPIPPRYLPEAPRLPPASIPGPFGRILEKYECLTCHQINGQGGTLAPDLSFAGSQARPEWIAAYFRLPYSLRPILPERMPLLGMSEEEIRTAVDYMQMVLLSDEIPRDIPLDLREPGLIRRGQDLYNQYACRACHQINSAGGYVGPPLDGLNRRLYPAYIYAWLKHPRRWRPETVEPKRNLSDEETAALTAFLYSLPPLKGTPLESLPAPLTALTRVAQQTAAPGGAHAARR